MDKIKGVHKLKNQIDETQSSVPTTSGMKAKEVGVVLLVMILGFCGYAIYKLF